VKTRENSKMRPFVVNLALNIYLQKGVRWDDVITILEEHGFKHSKSSIKNAVRKSGALHVPDGHGRCGNCKKIYPTPESSAKKRGTFSLCAECKAEGEVLPQHTSQALANGRRGPRPKWSREGSFYA